MRDGALKMARETLADVAMKEITRVRDEVMPAYYAMGRSGDIDMTAMRVTMDATIRALAMQDASTLMYLVKIMKGFRE